MNRDESQVSPTKVRQSQPTAVAYGNVIEYIQDKLYLASYTSAPTASTPFAWPTKEKSRRSGSKTSKSKTTNPSRPIVYFSIDKSLIYNAFHHDFGPLNIGHLYRFAITLHEVLAENPDRAVVFWTGPDAKLRANAACMLACYVVLIQGWPPHLALAPIAQMNPPCMPFRDAGYSIADFGLTVQDVVYGVWRAKEEKLCQLNEFSLEEYETFEQVHFGDFNWITPSFIALASPQDSIGKPITKSDPLYSSIPTTPEEIIKSDHLNSAFKNVLSYFTQRDVGLIVRLNDPLYSPTFFTANGIQHLDMIFDDGTCPTLKNTRQFIRIAHDMIKQKKAIAVHCKAGLGRTGCLIGAYLIYKHGFTANEVIAYMRFMRPGMVVGPQQHWLHLNQNTFREWNFEDAMREKYASMQPTTPQRNSLKNFRPNSTNSVNATTPQHSLKRPALEEITSPNDQSSTLLDDSYLPAPTPGQPRKTSKAYNRSAAKRVASGPGVENNSSFEILPDDDVLETEVMTYEKRVSIREDDDNGSGDEYQVQMMMRRTSRSPTSKSPSSSGRARRVASCGTSANAANVNSIRKYSGRVGSLGTSANGLTRQEGKVK